MVQKCKRNITGLIPIGDESSKVDGYVDDLAASIRDFTTRRGNRKPWLFLFFWSVLDLYHITSYDPI